MYESFKKLIEAAAQANEALEAIETIRHENQLSELIELGFSDERLMLSEFFPAFEKFLKSNETQVNKIGEIVKAMEAATK